MPFILFFSIFRIREGGEVKRGIKAPERSNLQSEDDEVFWLERSKKVRTNWEKYEKNKNK